MQTLIETDRTILRPFEMKDAETALSWFGDAEVMRYIPFGADSTVEATTERIGRYIEHQRVNGFSKWIIIDRSTNDPIGDAGFYRLPDNLGVELGYRLCRSHWGRGLATEVAQRWIELAGEFLAESTIFAFSHRDNSSSMGVL